MEAQKALTRRCAILALGVAAGLCRPGAALGQAKSKAKTEDTFAPHKTFNWVTEQDLLGNATTELLTTDKAGTSPQHLGWLANSPQICAPLGQDSNIYPTYESLKDLVFIDNPGKYQSARAWLKTQNDLDNPINVQGCAHVAQGIKIYHATLNGQSWTRNAYGTKYVLVASGGLKSSVYEASAVWLSDQEWDRSAPAIKPIYHDILTHRGIKDIHDACNR